MAGFIRYILLVGVIYFCFQSLNASASDWRAYLYTHHGIQGKELHRYNRDYRGICAGSRVETTGTYSQMMCGISGQYAYGMPEGCLVKAKEFEHEGLLAYVFYYRDQEAGSNCVRRGPFAKLYERNFSNHTLLDNYDPVTILIPPPVADECGNFPPISFWESNYTGGIVGLWDSLAPSFTDQPVMQTLNLTLPSSGSAPQYVIDMDLGAINFGTIDIQIPEYVFGFVRIILLICAGFTCRSIIFNG